MEFGVRIRYAIITIFAILLLIFSAWGIASISKRVFSGNKKTDTTQVQKYDLADYLRPNTSVKVTVEGPIVADETFVSYDIEVGQDFRQITRYKGYGKAVVSQKRYDNNDASYEAFMQALSRLGFTTKAKNSSGDSETGACPTGRRFIYELKDIDEQVFRTWNVSCNSTLGSFGGSATSVRTLFKNQIPDATAILSGSGL